MNYYKIVLCIAFGILPSLIWLFYYVRKDMHPEPKRMILKVFFWGMVITIPTYFLQVALSHILDQVQVLPFFNTYPTTLASIKWILVIALTEELLKYIVVKMNVVSSWAFDEPLDIMLYMVVAALGFAAVENVLYLFSPVNTSAILQTTIILSLIRFVGATFLHTLTSGLFGYFLALDSLRTKKRLRLVLLGLGLATLLHGLYNFSIMNLQSPFNLVVPVTILIGLIIFMLWDFNEIKKVKSICKI